MHMVEEVKPQYVRRTERARQTRAAVLDAARDLFVADGYTQATMAAIADHAAVAVQTVYAVFGNKASILSEVIDRSIAGDDETALVSSRDWMQAVWDAPTAEERLRAYAGAVRRIMANAGDLLVAVAAAAKDNPEVTELADTTESRRRAGATQVITSILKVGRLRPGLTRPQAIDVLWLLNGPHVFQHLVRNAGWKLDRYQQWLADAMIRELLQTN